MTFATGRHLTVVSYDIINTFLVAACLTFVVMGQIGDRFDVEVVPEFVPPRFNVPPTQIVPVIRQTGFR